LAYTALKRQKKILPKRFDEEPAIHNLSQNHHTTPPLTLNAMAKDAAAKDMKAKKRKGMCISDQFQQSSPRNGTDSTQLQRLSAMPKSPRR